MNVRHKQSLSLDFEDDDILILESILAKILNHHAKTGFKTKILDQEELDVLAMIYAASFGGVEESAPAPEGA